MYTDLDSTARAEEAREATYIYQHVVLLAQHLCIGLSNLRHFNHQPLCEISPELCTFDPNTQNAIIAFNILHADGSYVDASRAIRLFNQQEALKTLHCASRPKTIIRTEEVERSRAIVAILGADCASLDVDIFLAFLLEAFVERSQKEAIISHVEITDRPQEADRCQCTLIPPPRSPKRMMKRQPLDNNELSFRQRMVRRSTIGQGSNGDGLSDLYRRDAVRL
jgi:hypothetical protein